MDVWTLASSAGLQLEANSDCNAAMLRSISQHWEQSLALALKGAPFYEASAIESIAACLLHASRYTALLQHLRRTSRIVKESSDTGSSLPSSGGGGVDTKYTI